MRHEAKRRLEVVYVEMTAEEAGELYAELYRLASDELSRPYEPESQIAKLMRELANAGAPGT